LSRPVGCKDAANTANAANTAKKGPHCCQSDLPRRRPPLVKTRKSTSTWKKYPTTSMTCVHAAPQAGIGTRLDTEKGVAAAAQPPNPLRRKDMKTNEGTLDRALRVVAGLVLIGLAATGKVGVWGYIGVVPLLTGAVGMCPLYTVLGINTCALKNR
jgi:hypothetical protein